MLEAERLPRAGGEPVRAGPGALPRALRTDCPAAHRRGDAGHVRDRTRSTGAAAPPRGAGPLHVRLRRRRDCPPRGRGRATCLTKPFTLETLALETLARKVREVLDAPGGAATTAAPPPPVEEEADLAATRLEFDHRQVAGEHRPPSRAARRRAGGSAGGSRRLEAGPPNEPSARVVSVSTSRPSAPRSWTFTPGRGFPFASRSRPLTAAVRCARVSVRRFSPRANGTTRAAS